uniref:Nuclear valosin-containing protein-like n=1 Tax=Panagrellus redivivus TaxID=6233 RepID=A0A7E4ZSH0_PANRE
MSSRSRKMTRNRARNHPTINVPNSANNSVKSLYAKRPRMDDETDPTNGVSLPAATPVRPLKAKSKSKTLADVDKVIAELVSSVPRIGFKDFGGCEDQLLEACRLAVHLKHPELYEQLRIQPPKGFLVHGPPGCGKTMFAEVLAGELEIQLMKVNATELIAGISGETEEKIRGVFKKAAEAAPCILLLDEIDTIAGKRESAQREMERRIVTQLLSSMDELNKFPTKSTDPDVEVIDVDEETDEGNPQLASNKYVLVVGTTNRADSLDAAIRRAGRFDHEIGLGIPDEKAREKILQIVCKDMNIDPNLTMKELARLTPGYVGADLQALVREASMSAVHRIFSAAIQKAEGELMEADGVVAVPTDLEKALALIKSEEKIQATQSADVYVHIGDFDQALSIVVPSATREGFATVPNVSWNDIGALQDVRAELEWSILFPIKRPEDFELLSVSTKPQGILLCGPPGCGKTLLAKAIANETGMNFISVKGPELLSMYVGESERAIRTVFQRARDSSPCVIFFDEIDALCAKRSSSENSVGARVVNQLLTEMDGVESRKQVFMIGATNRPDIVDPAILRPGRLDKILFVDFPDAKDRADILRKATKLGTKPKVSPDVDFDAIGASASLNYYSGADLAALVHEASICALKERLSNNDPTLDSVSTRHFEAAMTKVRASVIEGDRKKYERLKDLYMKKQLGVVAP